MNILNMTGEVLKTVQSSGATDIDNAVAAAKSAQKQWAGMSGFERGQILKRAADLCRVRVNVNLVAGVQEN